MLQERVLSPRAIHFGAQLLFWGCYKKRAYEVHHESPPLTLNFVDEPYYVPLRPTLQDLNIPTRDEKSHSALVFQIYEKWHRTIEACSRCKLSKERDKLLAIAGFTQYLQASLNDECLAGLRRTQIYIDLCWISNSSYVREIPFANADRPSGWHAPSWSWAFANNEVLWPTFAESKPESLITLLNATASPSDSPDPIAGFLRTHGRLRSINSEIFRF